MVKRLTDAQIRRKLCAYNQKIDKRRIDEHQYARRYDITMTPNNFAMARLLGDGNASAGIRRALEELWRKEHDQ